MRLWWVFALWVSASVALYATEEGSWQKDMGKMAPPLIASGWTGTPVSLDAVRGNAVVLAFWNGDIPC